MVDEIETPESAVPIARPSRTVPAWSVIAGVVVVVAVGFGIYGMARDPGTRTVVHTRTVEAAATEPLECTQAFEDVAHVINAIPPLVDSSNDKLDALSKHDTRSLDIYAARMQSLIDGATKDAQDYYGHRDACEAMLGG